MAPATAFRKNAANNREHRGLDKADIFMNGAATSTAI